MENSQEISTISNHISNHLEFEQFLHEKELQETKKLLNNKFTKFDEIYEFELGKDNAFRCIIPDFYNSFNNLVLIVKSEEQMELHKLIDEIKFIIGGEFYDSVDGNFLKILLEHYNLTEIYQNNTTIIPIPFPLIMKNNVVFSHDSLFHHKELYVKFKSNVTSCSLRLTHYNNLNNQEIVTQNANFKNFINKDSQFGSQLGQVYKFFNFTESEIKSQTEEITKTLYLNHFSSHMFILFTDKFNNIIEHKIFDTLELQLNGVSYIKTTYELLVFDTVQKYKHIGYYYLNLKNLSTNGKFPFESMVNFSLVDSPRLKLKLLPEYINSEIKMHIGTISYNCLSYTGGCVQCSFLN